MAKNYIRNLQGIVAFAFQDCADVDQVVKAIISHATEFFIPHSCIEKNLAFAKINKKATHAQGAAVFAVGRVFFGPDFLGHDAKHSSCLGRKKACVYTEEVHIFT
jgi:hypothetical protein